MLCLFRERARPADCPQAAKAFEDRRLVCFRPHLWEVKPPPMTFRDMLEEASRHARALALFLKHGDVECRAKEDAGACFLHMARSRISVDFGCIALKAF